MTVIGAKDRVGRVQRQIRHAFVASNGEPLTIRQFLAFAYPKVDRYSHWHYAGCNRALPRFGVCLGRQPGHGRPNLWAPKPELMRRIRAT
jgi:hypothetical protein